MLSSHALLSFGAEGRGYAGRQSYYAGAAESGGPEPNSHMGEYCNNDSFSLTEGPGPDPDVGTENRLLLPH